jgi:hypothetical protein
VPPTCNALISDAREGHGLRVRSAWLLGTSVALVAPLVTTGADEADDISIEKERLLEAARDALDSSPAGLSRLPLLRCGARARRVRALGRHRRPIRRCRMEVSHER